MTQIFRANPFLLSRNRFIQLPGGEGDAMRVGDSIGAQFSDYRFAGAVIPFMYAGTNMRTGEQRLNFRDANGQPFQVSDAIVAHAGQIAAEMAACYIEAFPDFRIRTNLNPSHRDPIPRYKDPNDDPWRSFFGYDVIERVETELGEMVVAAGGFFNIRVGAGSSCGVPGIRVDGRDYAVRLDLHVDGGQIVVDPLNGNRVPNIVLETVPGQNAEATVPASVQVEETISRVAEKAAADFFRTRFDIIRLAVIRNLSHRNDQVLAARAVIRRSMETAGPALKDFLRERHNAFEPLHSDYLAMMDDLRNMTGPDEAHTADRTPDQHFIRRHQPDAGLTP